MPSIGTSARDSLARGIDEHLQPDHLRLVAVIVLVITGILFAVSFATSDRGRTYFGPPLGVDFAGFYVAAQVLEQAGPTRLYDPALHTRFYHAVLPNLPPTAAIPYVHPPFVAAALRPLVHIPYEAAVLVWLGISAVLFVAGLALLLRTLPGVPRTNWPLILLLCLAFEPFLMECLLGGQLSAVGFFSYALAWWLLARQRPSLAGIALGLCFYKPTLLVLTLPMLVIGRRWRLLLGAGLTGTILLVLSVMATGWSTCAGYFRVLLGFRDMTSSANVVFRTWKYVDLNNALQLVFGKGSLIGAVCFVALALAAVAWLGRSWWRWPGMNADQRQSTWAATLAWVPVVNVYVGFYDSILVVQSALLAADRAWKHERSRRPLIDSRLAYFLLAIWISGWFSQGVARLLHVQGYTLVLAAFAAFLTRQTASGDHDPGPSDSGNRTAHGERGVHASVSAPKL